MSRFSALIFVISQSCVASDGHLSLVQVRAEVLSRSAPDVDVDWLPKQMSWPEGPDLIRISTNLTDGAPMSFPNDELSAFGGRKATNTGTSAVGFGFQKCATSFVSRILQEEKFLIHPETPKEKHYLLGAGKISCCEGNTSEEPSYASYINDCFSGELPRPGSMTLDFTPAYGASGRFVDIMTALKGQAMQHNIQLRFLAIIRDPVARAVSAINMMRRSKNAYAEEEFNASLSDSDLDSKLMDVLYRRLPSLDGRHKRLISDGEYVDVLSKMVNAFGESAVLVVNSERLNEHRTWERIYDHIGFPMPKRDVFLKRYDASQSFEKQQQIKKYHKTNTERYVPSRKVLRALSKYYAPFDRRLWELLGQKWW